MILAFSKKTQCAITLGIAGFIVIYIFGDYALADFHLSGTLAFLSDVVRENLRGKYEEEAFGCLISCWLLAIRQYRKDKDRFYNSFQ